MMREREMRGLRAEPGRPALVLVIVVVFGDGEEYPAAGGVRSRAVAFVVVASAVAAAAREVGLTGGGMTVWFWFWFWFGRSMSGVVNIFLLLPSWRGLGGVLARCWAATIALVLEVLRIFASELAVGAKRRLLGLKIIEGFLSSSPLAPSPVVVPKLAPVPAPLSEEDTPADFAPLTLVELARTL